MQDEAIFPEDSGAEIPRTAPGGASASTPMNPALGSSHSGTPTLPPDLSPGVEVRPDLGSGGLGIYAAVPFKSGDRLGYFSGHATSVRSQMSLQFGTGLFIEPGPSDPLRNLNHACSPSARFSGMDLHAIRDLAPGDPITLDYTLHEDEMATPFQCKCGAATCLLEVRGWRFLTLEQKATRMEFAGDWLKAL